MQHNSAQPDNSDLPGTENTPQHKTSVLLADRNEPASKKLVEHLIASGDFEILGRITKARDILQAVTESNPQILILGLPLPHAHIDEIISHVHDSQPQCGIVLIGDAETGESILSGLAAGARGCLSREADAEQVKSAIASVCEGGIWIDPAVEAMFREMVGDAISSNAVMTSSDLFEHKKPRPMLLHTIELSPKERWNIVRRTRFRRRFQFWKFLAISAASLILALALLPSILHALSQQHDQPDGNASAPTTIFKDGQALRLIEMR